MEFSIDVARLRPVFGEPDGVDFVAVLPPELFERIQVEPDLQYDDVKAIACEPQAIPALLGSLQKRSHVFCISAGAPFVSPPAGAVVNVKLGVLPLYSTGFSALKLQRSLDIIYGLNYTAQYRASQSLISGLTSARQVVFESERFSTRATLDLLHSAESLYFFNQSGPIGWGRQSVLPNGEVSLLTDNHSRYSEH